MAHTQGQHPDSVSILVTSTTLLLYLSSVPEGTGTLCGDPHTETINTAIWIVYTQIECIVLTLVTVSSHHIILQNKTKRFQLTTEIGRAHV